MTVKETVKTWKWRIIKAGYSYQNFAESLGISQSLFSQYLNGKQNLSVDRFDMIETRLKELGV